MESLQIAKVFIGPHINYSRYYARVPFDILIRQMRGFITACIDTRRVEPQMIIISSWVIEVRISVDYIDGMVEVEVASNITIMQTSTP